jgi:hypothetical protein
MLRALRYTVCLVFFENSLSQKQRIEHSLQFRAPVGAFSSGTVLPRIRCPAPDGVTSRSVAFALRYFEMQFTG